MAHLEDSRTGESNTAESKTAPRLSRRHQAGASSARALLLTVLGEFVLPGDGGAWTSALLDVFARLGVAEKATRQALMRTSQAGWLQSERDGRRARWVLTPAAEAMLTDGADRIYAFGRPAEWDRRWVVVSVRIPEADRRARHVVRTRLTWAGFGMLAPGVWISPHSTRGAEAERVLTDAGVGGDANVFVAERSGLGEMTAMVATAWDLSALEAEYEEFMAEFAGPVKGLPANGLPANGVDVLVRQIELVHAWRRFPSIDPALPPELLPARWTGTRAAQLFTQRHEEWLTDARREWRRLNVNG